MDGNLFVHICLFNIPVSDFRFPIAEDFLKSSYDKM